MIFRVLYWRGAAHTTLKIFSDKRNATCGDLYMTNDEFEAFQQHFAGFADFIDKHVEPMPIKTSKPKGKR